ncbi:AAA-domain-containing protein [Rhizoclosmatium globosum]|uniref:AAA-domain-containing protein n=1 Tax=Rhizoclosmatium globosum TaxID=329046 RepID=A0A1Y2BTP6_9FUNG|nr:AAA-domain-containing protein [Rhizoclosmatium globosum]|eukprot:ORY38138.1 AAA-domain-containing protein [Rhizoclosmatium globosum]
MEVSKLRDFADRRVAEELKADQRKRNLMVLIMHHLQGHGYADTVARLQTECNLSLKKLSTTSSCNSYMTRYRQEYETYYDIKFGKTPKLVKKCAGDDSATSGPVSISKKKPTPNQAPTKFNSEELPSYEPNLPKLKQGGVTAAERSKKKKADSEPTVPTPTHSVSTASIKQHTEVIENFGVVGTKPKPTESVPVAAEPSATPHPHPLYETKLLKPLPHYESFELRELAAIITRDIYQENPNVHWNDIAVFQLPSDLCGNLLSILSGFLNCLQEYYHHGKDYCSMDHQVQTYPPIYFITPQPPHSHRNGKTLLAKAVATECKTTFFNISASSIVSKWRGDSEKLVRVLFELARYHAPSTIFIDEIEAIMGHRTSDGAEHEGSRRMKTELLIQMDGLAKTKDCVFLLAASNLPWDLDVAMLRRLEKRILIDLPDEEARASMFELNLPRDAKDGAGNLLVAELDYKELASQSNGYSGSDIQLVCKEAAMRPLRRLFDMIEIHDAEQGEDAPLTFTRQPVTMSDVLEALKTTRPSTNSTQTSKYKQWQNDFGSV